MILAGGHSGGHTGGSEVVTWMSHRQSCGSHMAVTWQSHGSRMAVTDSGHVTVT